MCDDMKVAIVHDWLVVNGGAEKVLAQILKTYPKADVYTLVDYLGENDRGWVKANSVTTSFIQRLPFSKSRYRNYFPLFPYAIEQFNLSKYDLVISSSYSVAKGVITGPNQLHVCYCHSPARYAWDLQHQYLKESNLDSGIKSLFARYFLHKFRMWDIRTANGVDIFVANSGFIKKRIFKCYRRKSVVINPPVELDDFTLQQDKSDYYLAASRMVPYKRIDLIVRAFKMMPNRKLKVIGEGPDYNKIKALCDGSENIELLGYRSDDFLIDTMKNAKAFIFAAEEDFGIMPVEAQACGTPVIAYGKGGALETVIDKKTGLHFKEQTAPCIIDAVNTFESIGEFSAIECRMNAEKFSNDGFKQKLMQVIDEFRDSGL